MGCQRVTLSIYKFRLLSHTKLYIVIDSRNWWGKHVKILPSSELCGIMKEAIIVFFIYLFNFFNKHNPLNKSNIGIVLGGEVDCDRSRRWVVDLCCAVTTVADDAVLATEIVTA